MEDIYDAIRRILASNAKTFLVFNGLVAFPKLVLHCLSHEHAYRIEQAAEALPPEQLRQLLAHITAKLQHLQSGKETAFHSYEIVTGGDGLPLIRGNGGTITSEMVGEIEGLAP
ncbi:MAG TPA: hypothetical protein VG733_05540 [Chthoniobacteraceae bacterium]|nr:hypothetical protein [Chthoniobacteraceae bacterium]